MQKHGLMANEAVKGQFVCVVCGKSEGFNWSDQHGEGMCNRCGTPYQLLQYDESENRVDAPPKCNIKEEWIPVLKQYWNETHEYMGLGSIMVVRDYPECVEGRRKFDEWMGNHPELKPEVAGPQT